MVRESRRPSSVGRCRLCGATFTKTSMARHLQTCRERVGAGRASAPEGGEGRLRERNGLLWAVEGYGLPEYWLFLEVSPTATWADLDAYLRDTWVECCGHLSEFKYDGVSYLSHPDGEPGARSMAGRLVHVVQPGVKFRYRYDFGTTTELVLHALTALAVAPRAPKVRVLARNDPPDIRCAVCGGVATRVCGVCHWDGEGWLCDACAPEHSCGTELLLPVVNSPRVGLCAYTGPTGE